MKETRRARSGQSARERQQRSCKRSELKRPKDRDSPGAASRAWLAAHLDRLGCSAGEPRGSPGWATRAVTAEKPASQPAGKHFPPNFPPKKSGAPSFAYQPILLKIPAPPFPSLCLTVPKLTHSDSSEAPHCPPMSLARMLPFPSQGNWGI